MRKGAGLTPFPQHAGVRAQPPVSSPRPQGAAYAGRHVQLAQRMGVLGLFIHGRSVLAHQDHGYSETHAGVDIWN